MSLAFVPWGDVGKTVCQRNINNRSNNRVLPQNFSRAGWDQYRNPASTSNSYYSFLNCPCVIFPGSSRLNFQGAARMEWTTPQHEEIELNCEVSSYANAEL